MTTTPLQQTFGFGRKDVETVPPPPQRRNLVIEAGAGTGKTTAIVAEVLKLMLDDEQLSPERIVLVTFTEKAAGEIADRIHAALAELELHFDDDHVAWPTGSPQPLFEVPPGKREQYRRACSKQLASIHLLRSQTIHSFCQSLLRQFPIEAGLDPQFKIIEGFERSLLYSELYDSWIDAETRTNATPEALREWEVLLAHSGYLFLVRNAIFALVDRRDLLGEQGLSFGSIAEFEDDLRTAVTKIRTADLSSISDDEALRMFEYIRRTPLPPEGSVDGWLDFFAPIAASIRALRLPRGKNNAELSDAIKILRASEKKSDKCMHERLASHRAAMALHALATRFIGFLDAEKRKLGVVDFDDLLLRTLSLLDSPEVLERARAQYDFIFVDEFQDTDRTQAKIIDRLARDASGAYVGGKTVAVGDPKQSIYGFRRADPETYFQMTKRLAAEGEQRSISDQYRSDPPLLDAINAMFAKVFPPQPAHDANIFRPEYKALRPAKTTCERDLDARLTFLHAECEEPSERLLAEAMSIARWIESRRDGGETDLTRFAILFRRLTVVDTYLDVFDRRGLDYVLPPTRVFLDRPAPVAMMAVLRAIAYPFDRGAQMSAARSPYFALTDEEIASGVFTDLDGGLNRMVLTGQLTAWSRFTSAIERYRDASRQMTVSQLMDLIVEATGIERVYGALADRQRAQRHLDHLRALAFDYDQRAGGSIRQFVDEIARRRSDPDEMEPLLADDGRNAIRILSVHAAKGLEFDTVILPDLGFAAGGNDAAKIFVVEEPKSLVLCSPDSISANFRTTASGEKLKRVAAERDEAEARRLFYVAVTRARTDVVFVHSDNPRVVKGSFYACLRDDAGVPLDSFVWPRQREVRTIDVGGVPVAVALESVPRAEEIGQRKRQRLSDPTLEDALALLPVVPLDLVEPKSTAVLSAADAAAARARSRSREAGILLHRFLELWDGHSPATQLLDALVAEAGLAEAAAARVRQRIGAIAKSDVMRRIAAAETVGREVPIRYVDREGAVVEKRIDRLLRENGRELVVDYKSGKPEDARLARDREQVATYCAAIAAITGRPCSGLLWYIDPETDVAVDV